MSGRIQVCRICSRKFKVPGIIHRVFPNNYDHSCCSECNAEGGDESFVPYGETVNKKAQRYV